LTQLFVCPDEVGEPQVLVELEHPSQFGACLFGTPGRLQALRKAQAAAQVERVFQERACTFLDGLLGTANWQKVVQRVVPPHLGRHRIAGHR
jgi:hypothetical protein